MQHIQMTAANLRVKKKKKTFKIERKDFCHISLETGDILTCNRMSMQMGWDGP